MNAPRFATRLPVTVEATEIVIPASVPSGYARQAQLLADATQSVEV